MMFLSLYSCEISFDGVILPSLTIIRVGYLIGAATICIDYFYLMTLYGAERRILFASFFIKISFIIIELAFILPFRIMAGMHHAEKNAAAILEWSMPSLNLLMS